jgi:hypothetical protein
VNPKRRGGATQFVYVHADDVDRHYETVKTAGAAILREPADQYYGDRTRGGRGPRRSPVVVRPARARRGPAGYAGPVTTQAVGPLAGRGGAVARLPGRSFM